MKKLIIKYRKFFTISSLFILLALILQGFLYIRYSFDQILDMTLKHVLADISHTTSSFSKFGVVVVEDVVLKDDKGVTILYSPKVNLKYTIKDILNGKITEINVEDPYVYIALDKDQNVNIVDVFAGESVDNAKNEDNKESEEDEVKVGTNIPINIITTTNARVLYQDNAYEKSINVFVNNVDGYVSFDKTDGIDLRFYNTMGEKKVEYAFNNYEKEYSMTIKLKNMGINQELMQYAYVDETTDYLGGKANLNLVIDTDGLWGNGYLSEVDFKSSAYDGIAKGIHGGVEFVGERIKLDLDGKLNEKDIKFTLKYYKEDVEINIMTNDLSKEDIKKVTILDDSVKKKIEEAKNFNISFLRLKFNIDKELNTIIDSYIRLDPVEIDGVTIRDFKGSVIVKDNKVKLKDISLFLNYGESEGYILVNGKYNDDILKLNFNILNNKGPLHLDELTGSLTYNLNDEKVSYMLYSKALKIGGEINLNEKIFKIETLGTKDIGVNYEGEYYSTENDIKVIYNYADNKLLLGKGKVKIKGNDSLRSLVLNFNNDGNKIYFNEIELFYNELKLSATGHLNVSDLSYDFKYKAEDLKIENFTFVEGLKTSINLDGTLTGKKEIFTLNSNLKNKEGEYGASYKNFSGRLKITNIDDLEVDFDGYLDEISYNDTNFKGLKIELNYKDNIINVIEVRNNILTINGYYNIINGTLDFSYKINELKENKIKLLEKYKVKMNLVDIDGSIKGSLENFKIDIYSSNAWIQYEDLPKINLVGEIKYFNQKIIFDDFEISENKINGYYDISTEKFRFKINMLTNNLADFYEDINFKYRLTGEVILWGTPDKVDGVFQTYANNIYFRGRKLPDLKMTLTYKGGNLKKLTESGHIDINNVTIFSDNRDEILMGNGLIDLKNQDFSFEIDDILDINKINTYLNIENVVGQLNTKFNIGGKFNNLKYVIKVDSKAIDVDGYKLENLKIDIVGDQEKVNLKEIKLNFRENTLTSHGALDLKNLDYKLNVKSNEIDLSVLNIFSMSKYFNEIKGIATIDIELKSDNNYGEFKIKDFSGDFHDYGVSITKVNTKIVLDEKYVKIDYFQGKINDGDINLQGYLNATNLMDVIDEGKKLIDLDLDYKLSLAIEKVGYSYGEEVKLVLSSNLVFTKNKIAGNFIINSGEISGIPEIDSTAMSGLTSQVKEIEIIKDAKELGENFEIKKKNASKKMVGIDINLKTETPIKLNIKKITPTTIVKDLMGDLNLNGNFKLEDEELSYNGMISIDEGSINLNNSLFYLSTATAKFIKETSDPNNFSPVIVLNANSTIANEEVYVNINGEYPDLSIQMSSGSGLDTDDIGSLLAFHNVGEDSNSNSNEMVKDVIDNQLSGFIFSPVSNEIANALGIDKFQISSDMITSEYEGGVYKDNGSLGLGASIEAEDGLYKDILYWKAKVRWGTSKYYNNVAEYDLALEHRITKNLSWGIGIGKVPEGRVVAKDSLMNYHIDLSWAKKYRSFKSMLLNILFIGGEE